MEVYEQINLIIEERNLTKKEFAQRLLALEPRSKRTGETMSEKAVYAYLSGKSVINADLIPYIAEALDIPEQALFPETPKARMRLLRHLLQTATQKEKDTVENYYLDNVLPKPYSEIVHLLKYASETSLKKITKLLSEMKAVSDKF